jgi:O-methyltransferase involved in polyketide biosynthesis
VYDWLLGGKDNYPVDETLGQQLMAVEPRAKAIARVNRSFMHRAIRWLGDSGISQYLDIGTGIPTEPNLHQVAQRVAPNARIVYVDNDPIVLRHAEALLRSAPEGVTDYIQADVHDPDKILELAGETLDFGRPVALSLVALLHFVPDDDAAAALVDRLLAELAPGSHLVLSHITGDFDPETAERATSLYNKGGVPYRPRSHAQTARFFAGLELVEPGLVQVPRWRPEPGGDASAGDDKPMPLFGGVARKP